MWSKNIINNIIIQSAEIPLSLLVYMVECKMILKQSRSYNISYVTEYLNIVES